MVYLAFKVVGNCANSCLYFFRKICNKTWHFWLKIKNTTDNLKTKFKFVITLFQWVFAINASTIWLTLTIMVFFSLWDRTSASKKRKMLHRPHWAEKRRVVKSTKLHDLQLTRAPQSRVLEEYQPRPTLTGKCRLNKVPSEICKSTTIVICGIGDILSPMFGKSF